MPLAGTLVHHPKHQRIEILDALRGVAILAMVFYHGMYDLCDIFGLNIPLFSYLSLLEPFFAGLFILLAGISCRFSHNNWLRGARVLALGLALTAFTMLYTYFNPNDPETIYFGILHFMGCAILLYALLGPLLNKIPRAAAFALWCLLFAFTFTMPFNSVVGFPPLGFHLPQALTTTPGLFAFGFPDTHFQSADYFPMIPWFFLFLAGSVIGAPIREHKLPEKFYTARVPFWSFAGRHTLLIYVLHQPIIYGILYLILVIILKKPLL